MNKFFYKLIFIGLIIFFPINCFALNDLMVKAKNGDSQAQCDLAFAYITGEEVKQDYKKAFYWYEKAANSGLREAQFRIGMLYYYWDGVAQDINKSVMWYTEAAKQGDMDAQ